MGMITLAKTKELLGIPTLTTTYDTQITANIPVIESIVKRITFNRMTLQVNGTMNALSKIVSVDSVYTASGVQIYDGNNYIPSSLGEVLLPGQMVEGNSLSTYIYDIFDFTGAVIGTETTDSPSIVLAAATASAVDISVSLITSVPIGLQSAIAHGIWWMISQNNTKLSDTAWTSKTVGPLSITRSAEDSKIDGVSGMPAWFVKSFPRYHR